MRGAVPGHNDSIVIVKPSMKLAMRESHKGGKK